MLFLWKKILPSTGINKTDKNIDDINWEDELRNKKIIFKNLDDRELKSFKIVKNFLDLDNDNWRKWRNKNSPDDILQILYGISESLNSGIDKGSPKEDVKVKPETERWLSNAFGSFKGKIIYLEKNESEINNIINEIKNKVLYLLDRRYISFNDLEKVREKIKNLFSGLLSDDRFPINDVSLWEQTFMPTSMFKALLADYILAHSDFNDIPDRQKVKWRILGIQYDKMGLAEKGFKLASIKWYRDISKEIDEEIKKLLEVEYPIGNEIYRDETGIYFIVGEGLGDDLNNGSNLAKLKDDLKELEDKILEIFREKTDDEFYPSIFLTKASRGLMNLSTLLENAKENFLKKKWEEPSYSLSLENEKGKAIGICPICKVRLIYEKDKEKNNKPTICEVCNSRVHHSQVASWIDNISGETIWIDEIKDKNNRITYISLKFELEDWLSGDLLNGNIVNRVNFQEVVKNSNKFLNILSKYRMMEQKIFSEANIKFNQNKSKFGFLKHIESKLRRNNIPNLIDKFLTDSIDIFIKVNKFNEINPSAKFNDLKNLIIDLKNLNDSKVKIDNNLNVLSKYLDNLIENLKGFFSFIEDFLIIYSTDSIRGYSKAHSSFNSYIRQIFFHQIIGTKWEDWIKQTPLNNKINWQEEKIKWEEFTDENDPALDILSALLLQFLLRKNPSPARLRRIWETTQEFFEKIHKNLDEDLKIPEWRKKRLVWEVECSKLKGEKSQELEDNNLLFWMEKITDEDLSNLSKAEKEEKLRQSKKAKIYLISSIEDFIEKFGNEDLLKKISQEENNIDISKDSFKNFKISLKSRSENKNEDETEILVTLTKDNLLEIHPYKPYSLITDISPINYQVIIPAEYLPKFIDKVLEKYNKEFKYVYGKLPIHIGIIVANYKKPLYVNLKALRKIRRDVKNTEKLWINEDAGKFCQLQKEKLSYATTEEKINNTEDYYALYFNNLDEKDYNFYIKPKNNWKYWVSTLDKFPLNSKIKIIPNTFDFEFMDANTRRNDIYYDENKNYKRALRLKSNRPYELEVYWSKFKVFHKLFKDKTNKAKMHKLVSLFYEKLQDYDSKYNPLLASAIINILELKKNKDAKKYISQIFDLDENTSNFQQELINKLNEEKLKLFIDMFEFWHTALKEV
ncbi:CRISPR-associated protein Csx11 [Persephonella sp. IF05-L8]|uniref:CRISPR-associated protein Csx11 n=1 Tax=Persephonella sp. IF05-L8 TaxID=1158338 RepID=UPI000689F969